ncbi:hypothetical protein [Escherichia phage Ecp_YSF]|nr:hypothetical protein [Escherichia phage Ecp_YSF]
MSGPRAWASAYLPTLITRMLIEAHSLWNGIQGSTGRSPSACQIDLA